MLNEPLSNEAAKRLILDILKSGTFEFSTHAFEKMTKDALTTVDCVNVLRGGVVEFAEEANRTWRYRVRTARIYVVVAFRSETHLRIVTTWRVKR